MKPNVHHNVSVKPIKKSDLDALVQLNSEFEEYLIKLDKNRKPPPQNLYRKILLKDAFGKHPAFNGLIARRNRKPIGYVLYHPGYDPDEMSGRVLYVIDLYVAETERNKGTGLLLMNSVAKICKKMNGIDIYFGVWVKNKAAIAFYKKLGAEFIRDVPFMHWPQQPLKPPQAVARSNSVR